MVKKDKKRKKRQKRKKRWQKMPNGEEDEKWNEMIEKCYCVFYSCIKLSWNLITQKKKIKRGLSESD